MVATERDLDRVEKYAIWGTFPELRKIVTLCSHWARLVPRGKLLGWSSDGRGLFFLYLLRLVGLRLLA